MARGRDDQAAEGETTGAASSQLYAASASPLAPAPARPRSHPPPRPHRTLTLAPTLTLPLTISPSPQALEAACKGFGWTWPTSDANFLLVEVGSAAKAGALYERCRDGGVLVRYWGSRPELATKLRVTVGTKESVDKFVSIVTQALPSLEGM